MGSRLQDKILAGESKVLEFKEILPQRDKMAKTVIVFSNTSGEQLIIGVGDDGTIIGIDPDVDGKLLFIMEVYRGNLFHLAGVIKGVQRGDRYEIPMEAIREVILNAYVHRDYINLGWDIKVGIYDDIVNIVSLGGGPSSITIEDVLAGRTEMKNKGIARVFKELDYIEQWGSGIKRIFSWCEEAGVVKPLITEKGDFVDVELYREYRSVQGNTGNTLETSESVREKRQINLNEKQIMTLEFCSLPRTSKEIFDVLEVTYHSRNINYILPYW